MLLKIQYDGTAEERQRIISENSNLKLIQEDNITEGNFLVFSNDIPDKPLTEQMKELEQQNAELLLDLAMKDGRITEVEQTQADLILDLTMKGVI